MRVILFAFSILIFVYTNIVEAINDLEIVEIKSIVSEVTGSFTYATPELGENGEDILNVEDSGSFFRVNFLVNKTPDQVEPETLQLYLADNSGQMQLKQSQSVGGAPKATKICSTIDSVKGGWAYRCFIIDPGDFTQQKFMVKVLDDQGKEIMQIVAEKPKLKISLEKKYEYGAYDTLALNNLHDENIEIVSAKDGERVLLNEGTQAQNVIIPPKGSHNMSVKVNQDESYRITYTHKIERFTDIIPIEFIVDGMRLQSNITIVGDNTKAIERADIKEWAVQYRGKKDAIKKLKETNKELEKLREVNEALKKSNGRYFWGSIVATTVVIAIISIIVYELRGDTYNNFFINNVYHGDVRPKFVGKSI